MGYNTFIVLTGAGLLGACAGIVGTFAVLRRRALMGDALAHAALPGVCLAFLLVGERDLPLMLLGALISGLVGILIVTGLRFGTRIKEDAAIGIVLSVFYGAGIALSRTIQNQTTGGSRAGLESYILGKTSGMIVADVVLIGTAALCCLCLVLLMYKEFKVVAFDPDFATSQGWPSFRIDLILMLMIAVTVVIGLPAVGVVLVAALLIIPAAAARFWTDRLGMMLLFSAIIGAATGGMGTLASSQFRWAAGPAIVLTGTVFFLFSMLFSPKRGILQRIFADIQLRKQDARSKLLRAVYAELGRQDFVAATFDEERVVSANGRMRARSRRAVNTLVRNGNLVRTAAEGLSVTAAGWRRAVEAVRDHRLRELYLTEFAGAATQSADWSQGNLAEVLPAATFSELESRLQSADNDPRDIHLQGIPTDDTARKGGEA